MGKCLTLGLEQEIYTSQEHLVVLESKEVLKRKQTHIDDLETCLPLKYTQRVYGTAGKMWNTMYISYY